MTRKEEPAAAAASRITCRRLQNGRLEDDEVMVIREEPLSIYVDGEYLVTASVTPVMEKEFVTGYLYGQGFIDSTEDISSLDIHGGCARVTTGNKDRLHGNNGEIVYRIVSGGGSAAFRDKMPFPAPNPEMRVEPQAVFKAMNAVFAKASLYAETEGAHAAGMFDPQGESICLVEDIGRHNCLDKAIGYALLNRINCSEVMLATTGRMATEMVGKICRAGIPVAASKTAVTAEALALARRHGLTLIGFVRDSGTRINTDMSVRVIMEAGMKIYTGASRVAGT